MNIYFTKLWDGYHNFFEKIVLWVKVFLSNRIAVLDWLEIPELLSYTFYGSEILIAILVVFVWLYFSTYEISDINQLNNELKKYDLHYNISIRNIKDDIFLKR